MLGIQRTRIRHRGSTLAEVLVVTAALSTLGSGGAFTAVKDKSKQQKCAHNLRQLGMAIQMFTADNDGRLPTAAFFPTKATKKRGLKSIHEVLASYAGNKDLFKCPGAPDAINKLGIAYLWNDLGNNFLLDNLENPGTTWIMADISAAATVIDKELAEEKKIDLSVIPPAHVGGYNVLYADGHVKWSKAPPKIVVQKRR